MESHANKRRCQNGKNENLSNYSSHKSSNPSSHSTKKVLTKHSGSLEIIEGDASGLYSPDCDEYSESSSRPTSQGLQRPWSRSSMGSVPPRSDSSLSRRLATPTKQISLQAVKRKEESSESFAADVDLATLNLDKSYNRAWDFTSYTDEESSRVSTPKFDPESDLYAPQHATHLRLPRPQKDLDTNDQREAVQEVDGAVAGFSSLSLEAAEGRVEGNHVASSETNEEEGDDDDDEGDSSEEEERKAPNELLIEFVECLMKKDYKNAEKLCKMILLYEPTNPEALKFKPVIEEKLRLDAEAEAEEAEGNEEDDDEEEDDEDDDEDDDDDGDDDSSSDEDEDSDDSDDDDEDEESIFRVMAEAVAANYYSSRESSRDQSHPQRPDSGIMSDSER